MTLLGESLWETQRPTRSTATPKIRTQLGTWNVRTKYDTGMVAQVAKEMGQYGIEVLGISECRWTGMGNVQLVTGETVAYVGEQEKHRGGVAIMMSTGAKKSLMEWLPVSSMIICGRFHSAHKKVTMIQVHAPTNYVEDEMKEDFYTKLQETVNQCHQNDMIAVMVDFNANVRRDNRGRERVMGRHGAGEGNDNGEGLCEFTSMNEMVIEDTLFPHKQKHRMTWISLDGKTENQIDHILASRRMRTSLLDARTMRGADVGSDYNMIRTSIRMKLKRNKSNKQIRKCFGLRSWKTQ